MRTPTPLAIAAAAFLLATAAIGQNSTSAKTHRVAGLSVTVNSVEPSGAGMEVEFGVQMTTQTETFNTATSPNRGFGGGVQLTTVTSSAGGFGGLGNRRVYSYYQGSGSAAFSDAVFFAGSSGSSNQYFGVSGTLVRRTLDRTDYLEGELPAINFGDGNSLSETSLEYLSQTTNSGSPRGAALINTRWRSSFSHTYASAGEFEVVVASRCCGIRPRTVVSPSRGMAPALYTGEIVYPVSPSQIQYAGQTTDTSVFVNAVDGELDRGPQVSPFDGTFNRSFGYSGTFGSEDQGGSQVVNRALIRGNPLAVPATSGVGLAALAGLLLVLGMVLLRKS